MSTPGADRTPLVIDTDPGVDDAFALAVAAGSPEVDLVAVTTTFGNVDLERTTTNARRVLGLLGRGDVPVGRGADRPLIHPVSRRAEDVHGDDGLGGVAERFAPLGPEPVGRAQDVLADALEGAREPVVLAAIGPLTNVALLLATRPDLAPRIARLVVMGGVLGIGGNVSPASEFNVWSDPEAARRVLVEETVPTTLVPLDLTHECAVDGPWLEELAASGPVGAALAATRIDHLAHDEARRGRPSVALHDAVALLEAVAPGTLATAALPVEVDTSLGPARGATIADRRGTPGETLARVVDVALPPGALPPGSGGVDTDLDEVRAAVLERLRGA